jgi:hypothetical protein
MLVQYLRKVRTRRRLVGEQSSGVHTDEIINRMRPFYHLYLPIMTVNCFLFTSAALTTNKRAIHRGRCTFPPIHHPIYILTDVFLTTALLPFIHKRTRSTELKIRPDFPIHPQNPSSLALPPTSATLSDDTLLPPPSPARASPVGFHALHGECTPVCYQRNARGWNLLD